MALVNITISMVIMKETKPRVNRFNGNVNTRRMVPRVALTKPIMKPAKSAHQKFSTVTAFDGRIQAAIKMARPETRILIKNLIMQKFRSEEHTSELQSRP